jgi:hypothetical protein
MIKECTGLFIRPSGISDPCGTVAGMVTPKGSMSTEGETLQVSVLPYTCSTLGDAADVNPVIKLQRVSQELDYRIGVTKGAHIEHV